jgi:L-ascorbate metabolism protein UlaG (beta-lactamase superfamily)
MAFYMAGPEKHILNLTFLGHSAVKFELEGLCIYVDPYLQPPVDRDKLTRGDLILFSHGHFDHGVHLAGELYERWGCSFAGPKPLMNWMARKFRKKIPHDKLLVINQHESIKFQGLEITSVPALHPVNRLGKTIMALFARSKAPGKPVNGYYFAGFYHAGATIYTPAIAEALKGKSVHTALLPIGGKYATASPKEALKIAEELGAARIVPMHWQPLKDQVFFRYQASDLVKLSKETSSSVQVKALAIGELLTLEDGAQIADLV